MNSNINVEKFVDDSFFTSCKKLRTGHKHNPENDALLSLPVFPSFIFLNLLIIFWNVYKGEMEDD